MPTNIKNQKEEKRAALLRALALPKTTRAILLSYIQDEKLMIFLREACDAIGVKLITGIDEAVMAWADAFISDTLEDIPISELVRSQVVPIIPQSEWFEKIFLEFNPMKFEGNAFIFESPNQYLMFEKVVRYLENIRYPGDKRTLLQNIQKTVL